MRLVDSIRERAGALDEATQKANAYADAQERLRRTDASLLGQMQASATSLASESPSPSPSPLFGPDLAKVAPRLVTPSGQPIQGSAKAGSFKPRLDPAKVILTSLDGSLTTTLEFYVGALQRGTGRRVYINVPGVSKPIEVFDLTVAMSDSRAVFPTDQLSGPTTIGAGKAESKGNGTGNRGGSGIGTSSSPQAPQTTSSSGGKALEIKLPPPTKPTPGEIAIVAAIREEFGKSRQQARSDGGAGLRAQGLA